MAYVRHFSALKQFWTYPNVPFEGVIQQAYNSFVPHYFYLARCNDDSLYAGTCIDLAAREAKHNDGTGAKYTRGRGPVKIIYHEEFETLSDARKREAEVKKWDRERKQELLTRRKKRTKRTS